MSDVEREGSLIKIGGDRARVESGRLLKSGTANAELLSNEKTADHYQLGARDALGNPIEEGKRFHYRDYLGDEVFFYYVRRDLSEEEQAERETSYSYVFEELGHSATEDEAIEAAKAALRE